MVANWRYGDERVWEVYLCECCSVLSGDPRMLARFLEVCGILIHTVEGAKVREYFRSPFELIT